MDPEYVIGPGDTVQVFVWRNPELSVTVPVRPDGKISTPLVEDMVAVGKTSSQLAREIEKVLAEYIRSPQVNIIVTNPVSAFSQIKVIGEVANAAVRALPRRPYRAGCGTGGRRFDRVCRRQSCENRAQGRGRQGRRDQGAAGVAGAQG